VKYDSVEQLLVEESAERGVLESRAAAETPPAFAGFL
jgi:hypothetical protein